jgi:signal transduction histidine kinase
MTPWINIRARLVDLGPDEIRLVIAAGDSLRPHFETIVDEFYVRMQNHEPLREIIGRHTTTMRLKQTFRGYLERLFSGQYDGSYDQNRVQVGLTHDRVKLPLMWYLGMFSSLESMLFDRLQPLYESKPLSEWLKTQRSISSLIKYDQLLAVDAYVDASFSTLRTQTAEAEKARKAKSVFLATVSHELRTPLTSIMGYTDLILDTAKEISPQTRQHLQVLHRNANNLLSIINGLIEIGRVDGGKWQSSPSQGSINALLDDMAINAEGLLAGKQVRLDRAYQTRGDEKIYTDFSKLRQVLLNLVSNACKFTDTGAITLDRERANGALILTITDTGPGIPDESKEKVFEEFYRISGSKKPGSGLGLSLVKSLVESLGGTIKVADAAPHGCEFKVTIPLT